MRVVRRAYVLWFCVGALGGAGGCQSDAGSAVPSTQTTKGSAPAPGGQPSGPGDGGADATFESGSDGAGGCVAPRLKCGELCVDPQTDVGHCGACEASCVAQHVLGASCVQGQCQGSCEGGFGDCNLDLRADGCETQLRDNIEHCGGCGQACSSHKVESTACVHGVCVGACQSGFGDCNKDLRADGCEVDLGEDPNHCGACHNACQAGHKCQSGQCVLDCDAGLIDCEGSCVDPLTHPQHCGGCGDACSANGIEELACEGGQCQSRCDEHRADCNEDLRGDGCEVDVRADPDHCGACGQTCSGHQVRTRLCSFGECKPRCAPGFGDCSNDSNDGCETSLDEDPSNCGFCGFRCEQSGNMRPGANCAAGVCQGRCNDGFKDCNRDPSDACEADLSSVAHCGDCDVNCVRDMHFTNESARCAPVGSPAQHRCEGQCQPNFADCDLDPVNGCEADLARDREHCGACGQACAPDLVCERGACVSSS